jgi:hypothetical protein
MTRASGRDSVVHRSLHALGGEATVGDLVAVTALTRFDVGRAIEGLIADGLAHVRVSEWGDVVHHVGPGRPMPAAGPAPTWLLGRLRPTARRSAADQRRTAFDRKTVQLIRAREGVLSVAELVEHTGLRVAEARREMQRLAERFGGVPQESLDGHIVHAFPELMASAHGCFPNREPRPAWVRADAPIVHRAWWARFFVSRTEKLRRHVLGLVIQTALAGKGVVSLERALAYLRARDGRGVGRPAAEAALRQLAADFDAPVTELSGDLFFGFRNVKRQFLASQIVRRRVRLARTAAGATVFDTADSAARATERDLEAFDRELKKTMTALG